MQRDAKRKGGNRRKDSLCLWNIGAKGVMSRPSSYYDPEERQGSSFIVPMPDLARSVLPAPSSAFSHPAHHTIPASARQHRYSDLVELGDYRPAHSPTAAPFSAKVDPASRQLLPAVASPHHAQQTLGRSASLSASSRMAYSPQYSPPWNDPTQLPNPQYSPQPAQSNPMRRGMSYEAAQPPPSPYAGLRTPAIHPNRLSTDWPSTAQHPPELARHDSYSPSHYAAPVHPSHPYSSSSNAFYSPHIPSPSHSRPPSQLQAHAQSRPQAQPQPQQYYQSQQYLDSKHGAVASSSRRPSATRSAPDSYTSYHTGEEHYTGSPQKSSTGIARGRGKGFRRVRSLREVETVVNAQPAGRRGDPETGGFISVSPSSRESTAC